MADAEEVPALLGDAGLSPCLMVVNGEARNSKACDAACTEAPWTEE
jgi:hypothetical protein